jgi:hypothetical protein
VLSAFEQSKVDPLRQPLRIAQAAIELQPMFVLKAELPHAARSFAPKFADILRRRVILFGDDPFATLSIPRDAQVRQLRQQVLNLVLRLRASYVARSLREEQANLMIAGAIGPLQAYAATLLDLAGRPAASSSQALETIAAELGVPEWSPLLGHLVATQESRIPAAGEALRLYFQLLDLACRMQAWAEALPAEVSRESL